MTNQAREQGEQENKEQTKEMKGLENESRSDDRIMLGFVYMCE